VDEVSLQPEYRFEWNDGTVRETTDPSFTTLNVDPTVRAEAVEHLAQLGRDDDSCTVKFLSMREL
jgi:hypothetical protein